MRYRRRLTRPIRRQIRPLRAKSFGRADERIRENKPCLQSDRGLPKFRDVSVGGRYAKRPRCLQRQTTSGGSLRLADAVSQPHSASRAHVASISTMHRAIGAQQNAIECDFPILHYRAISARRMHNGRTSTHEAKHHPMLAARQTKPPRQRPQSRPTSEGSGAAAVQTG